MGPERYGTWITTGFALRDMVDLGRRGNSFGTAQLEPGDTGERGRAHLESLVVVWRANPGFDDSAGQISHCAIIGPRNGPVLSKFCGKIATKASVLRDAKFGSTKKSLLILQLEVVKGAAIYGAIGPISIDI